MSSVDLKRFQLEPETPFVHPRVASALAALTGDERRYAHFLSKASWVGGLVVLYQTSWESPGIFLLLHKFFHHSDLLDRPVDKESEEMAFLMYAAGFFGNMGNYKAFGDTKIVPALPQAAFERILRTSPVFGSELGPLWDRVKDRVYDLSPGAQQLGLGNHKGTTTYFSSNCEEADSEVAQRFMLHVGLPLENTRLMKEAGGGGYTVLLASAHEGEEGAPDHCKLGVHDFEGHKFTVKRGDYCKLLYRVNTYLLEAIKYAANDNQREMLKNYVDSFRTGSLDKHKEGSRHWIRDKGPVVESYIGFIETYRDPVGNRAEFEGFVAVVDKAMSEKFSSLVSSAETLLQFLPWERHLEKDTFLKPDFTSLDMLTFGGSGCPAGINIPNYDDIRQNEGFKNVSLGNVINAPVSKSENITFLSEADKQLFKEYKGKSFEVQVGLHELLGHGSGKLIYETNSPAPDLLTSPLDGRPLSSWYLEGQTYDSQFGPMGSSYEECRAECVGLLLCGNPIVLSIFGFAGEEAERVEYVNWLLMVRAGLLALEFYDPEKRKWGQAHMQARYAILQVLVEAGDGLVTVEPSADDILITLDYHKIKTTGIDAIGSFLQKLQVYKATADVKAAQQMYDRYTTPDEKFANMRSIVLAKKQPRQIKIFGNTFINKDGEVELETYEESAQGAIRAMTRRFEGDPGLWEDMRVLWEREDKYFNML